MWHKIHQLSIAIETSDGKARPLSAVINVCRLSDSCIMHAVGIANRLSGITTKKLDAFGIFHVLV